LGYCLFAENGNKIEALSSLKRAAVAFPKARLVSAQILAESGRRDDAVQELEKYVDSVPPGAPFRKEVEEQIVRLQQ